MAQEHVLSLVKGQRKLATAVGKRKRKVLVLGTTHEMEALVKVGRRLSPPTCR